MNHYRLIDSPVPLPLVPELLTKLSAIGWEHAISIPVTVKNSNLVGGTPMQAMLLCVKKETEKNSLPTPFDIEITESGIVVNEKINGRSLL